MPLDFCELLHNAHDPELEPVLRRLAEVLLSESPASEGAAKELESLEARIGELSKLARRHQLQS